MKHDMNRLHRLGVSPSRAVKGDLYIVTKGRWRKHVVTYIGWNKDRADCAIVRIESGLEVSIKYTSLDWLD